MLRGSSGSGLMVGDPAGDVTLLFCAKRKIEARDGRRGDRCATYEADIRNGEIARVGDIDSGPVLVFARLRCEHCCRPEAE
jgi:hypothetical protein